MTKITILLADCKDPHCRYQSVFDCPAARATNRVLKPEYRAVVGSEDVDIELRGDENVHVPYFHKFYLHGFNHRLVENATEDFSYEVDIPAEFLR